MTSALITERETSLIEQSLRPLPRNGQPASTGVPCDAAAALPLPSAAGASLRAPNTISVSQFTRSAVYARCAGFLVSP